MKKQKPKNPHPEESGLTRVLNDALLAEYAKLDDEGAEIIDPAKLATAVYETLDERHGSPELVKWAAILELRQLARAICARRDREEQEETESAPLFEMELQARYPARRDGEDVYVLLDYLTVEEWDRNIERLRHEADSKLAHAALMETEKERRIELGLLPGAAVDEGGQGGGAA